MSPRALDLTGRVALVTGASSGLGARFSRILASAGAKVVLVARRQDRLETLAAQIESAGGRALAVAADVSREQSVVAAYDQAERVFGPVDTIVANAGIAIGRPALQTGADDLSQILAVNLQGVFFTVREAARRLAACGPETAAKGRVVIVSSITAHDEVEEGLAVYSATKAGVFQMGRVLAREWAPLGINVNMLCPGYIRTELTAGWLGSPPGRAKLERFVRKRAVAIEALDVPLLYLASDASAMVTGSAFTIDDGQSL